MSATVARGTPASRAFAVVAALAVVALVLMPFFAGRADMRLASEVLLYLSLACLWNLLAGYAGLISVGQQAYVGLGGYVLFALAIHWDVHPLAALPLVALVGAVLAMPVAALIFRLHGAYFAIGTWVIAEIFRLTAAQATFLGGGSGTSLPIAVVKSVADSRADRESAIYWAILALSLLSITATYLLLRSKQGLSLAAIRDNELSASSLGIDIWRAKFLVYTLVACLTATLGALVFLQKLRISPDAAFSVNEWTAFVIFIVVIGGIGTLEGPIIGTLVFFALRETLADLGSWYLIFLGLVAIVIMLYAPKGIWGLVRDRYKLELFPITRRVVIKKE